VFSAGGAVHRANTDAIPSQVPIALVLAFKDKGLVDRADRHLTAEDTCACDQPVELPAQPIPPLLRDRAALYRALQLTNALGLARSALARDQIAEAVSVEAMLTRKHEEGALQ
jgi:hypothetical protein